MTGLNSKNTPKVSIQDKKLTKRLSDGTSIFINPTKKDTTRGVEEERIKGGGSQRNGGSKKIRRKNKRERKLEPELVFSLDLLIVSRKTN